MEMIPKEDKRLLTDFMENMDKPSLRRIIHYEPSTGQFVWLVRSANMSAVGRRAGSVKSDGYYKILIRGKQFMAHRLAFLYMTGSWPKEQVDHINGVRNDNRWENLRECSQSENQIQ